MILDGIIELLNRDSAVNAVVDSRIYKSDLPRGYKLAAIAVHRYNGSQNYDFNGPVTVGEDMVQLDIYAGDADTCQSLAKLVKAVLNAFIGALPDGTVVQGCYLERDMDMPYMAKADTAAITNRTILGYRVVNNGK